MHVSVDEDREESDPDIFVPKVKRYGDRKYDIKQDEHWDEVPTI